MAYKTFEIKGNKLILGEPCTKHDNSNIYNNCLDYVEDMLDLDSMFILDDIEFGSDLIDIGEEID